LRGLNFKNMAKQSKTKEVKIVDETKMTSMQLKQSKIKEVSTLTIEMIKKVGGMEIGSQKTLPTRLANQMVALGNAKLI
jgi:hypothetical protein